MFFPAATCCHLPKAFGSVTGYRAVLKAEESNVLVFLCVCAFLFCQQWTVFSPVLLLFPAHIGITCPYILLWHSFWTFVSRFVPACPWYSAVLILNCVLVSTFCTIWKDCLYILYNIYSISAALHHVGSWFMLVVNALPVCLLCEVVCCSVEAFLSVTAFPPFPLIMTPLYFQPFSFINQDFK